MIHSTKDAGPKLKFELYKAAMKALEQDRFSMPWEHGWPLIRAKGKNILNDDKASDPECAEAVILRYSILNRKK